MTEVRTGRNKKDSKFHDFIMKWRGENNIEIVTEGNEKLGLDPYKVICTWMWWVLKISLTAIVTHHMLTLYSSFLCVYECLFLVHCTISISLPSLKDNRVVASIASGPGASLPLVSALSSASLSTLLYLLLVLWSYAPLLEKLQWPAPAPPAPHGLSTQVQIPEADI